MPASPLRASYAGPRNGSASASRSDLSSDLVQSKLPSRLAPQEKSISKSNSTIAPTSKGSRSTSKEPPVDEADTASASLASARKRKIDAGPALPTAPAPSRKQVTTESLAPPFPSEDVQDDSVARDTKEKEPSQLALAESQQPNSDEVGNSMLFCFFSNC